MVTDARGNAYDPSRPPTIGGEAAIRDWAAKEFGRIASALKGGRAQFLSLDVLQALPPKPFVGMVGFFAAGVVPGGAGEGLYERRSDNAWHKL